MEFQALYPTNTKGIKRKRIRRLNEDDLKSLITWLVDMERDTGQLEYLEAAVELVLMNKQINRMKKQG